MDITTDNIFLVGSVLLFISLFAGSVSFRYGVPTLVFFLLVGMLAGSEGIGGIYFDDPKVAQLIGVIALNFILFSGGFETSWKAIKPIMWQGITLSTAGVLITAVLLGLFVWWVTDFNLYEGMLLGAIVSSTDAAAVFSILRSKSLGLKNNLRPTLELESGSNDPMAYFLTIAFTGLVLKPDGGLTSVIPFFFQQIVLGALLGFGMGKLGTFLINSLKLFNRSLYPILMIAIMFFTFSLTDLLKGNGFLAVYLAAVYIGNQPLIHKKTIANHFESYAWLMQIVLFLTLGLLVFPSGIIPIVGVGLLISAFLIVIARPVSVFLGLMFFKTSFRSKAYISWVGLRGAVPIVFATYPLIAGVEKAQMIFNIVFFISLSSVILQGTTLSVLARWLGLLAREEADQDTAIDTLLSEGISSELMEIVLPEDSPINGRTIVQLNFPRTASITMIQRNGRFISPGGSTVLRGGDKLVLLSETKAGMEEAFKSLKLPVEDEERPSDN
jgi:cell volume regulation protein A